MLRHAHASLRSVRITLGAVLTGLTIVMLSATAQALIVPALPTVGSGSLVLRLDANAINGGTLNIDGSITANANPGGGASVPTWKDLSGNGNDAFQATLVKQPTFLTNQTPNDSGAVSFNGSTYLFNPATISGPTTWFIIYNAQGGPSAPDDFQAPISLRSTDPATAGTDDQVLFMYTASGIYAGYQNITLQMDAGSSGVGISPTLDSSNHLLAFTYAGSDPTVPGNYTAAYDQTNTAVNASGSLGFGFSQEYGTIGQRGNDYPGAFYNGNISAILVYSGALNSTDFNAVQSYLNKEFLVAPEPTSAALLLASGGPLLRRRRRA